MQVLLSSVRRPVLACCQLILGDRHFDPADYKTFTGGGSVGAISINVVGESQTSGPIEQATTIIVSNKSGQAV